MTATPSGQGARVLTLDERNTLGVNLQTAYETLCNVAKLSGICTDCWQPFNGKRCYCKDNE